jgi:non-ribosomal peptide synthetase component F
MRKYVGGSLPYQIKVEEVEAEQDPGPDFIDTPNIVFKWSMEWQGTWSTIVPTRISTGHYQAVVTPPRSGTLFWRWETKDTLNTVKEGHDIIKESAFEMGRC